jgi:hypothetical protein
MWCAQTDIDRKPIRIVARHHRRDRPKSGLREKTGMTSDRIPKNGTARMYTSGWPKNQKKVLPQDRIATLGRDEEGGPEPSVEQEHRERRGDGREGE